MCRIRGVDVSMWTAVILAVGLDSSWTDTLSSVWQSNGYLVTSVGSIRDAIDHFRSGDFDLVLLNHSIPAESRERLTFLIRASGSHVPVASISDSSSNCDTFVDATFMNEPNEVLQGIDDLLIIAARMSAMPTVAHGSLHSNDNMGVKTLPGQAKAGLNSKSGELNIPN